MDGLEKFNEYDTTKLMMASRRGMDGEGLRNPGGFFAIEYREWVPCRDMGKPFKNNRFRSKVEKKKHNRFLAPR
jgi:hypothetical protein